MNKLIPFFLLLTTSAIPLVAQSPAAPPSPPLISPMPQGITWSVDITRPGVKKNQDTDNPPSAAPQAPAPVRMERSVDKAGKQVSEILLSDGQKNTFYIIDEYILQKYDNSSEVAVFLVPKDDLSNGIFDSLRVASFPCLEWISPNNYAGVDLLDEQQCYKYQRQSDGEPELQAWIRVADKFPVRVRIGSVIYNFSPLKAFSGDVALPAQYQQAYARLQTEKRVLEAMKRK